MKKTSYLSALFIMILTTSHAEDWSTPERKILKSLSLKTSSLLVSDPSNKYLSNSMAIQLGKSLFSDTRLSSNKQVSCSSCHIKEKAFTDNKTVALGVNSGLRNTPTLLNAASHNWFFWDGSKDSLWAQALSSIENPAEHNFSRVEMLHFIATNPTYRKQYELLFEHLLPQGTALDTYPKKAGPNANLKHLVLWKKLPPNQKDTVNKAFTNIGKAIASYVSTLQSQPTRFDLFVEELINRGQSNLLNGSEQRGLKLFISQQSGCINCHHGTLFSNKEFHNTGTGIRAQDNGRSEVIDAVIWDEYNCLGKYSDAKPELCEELQFLNRDKHTLAGTFKTPSLRNIKKTAPYMHDGRLKSLKQVLKYYASIDKTMTIETDLPVIELSKVEQLDIVNFLSSL